MFLVHPIQPPPPTSTTPTSTTTTTTPPTATPTTTPPVHTLLQATDTGAYHIQISGLDNIILTKGTTLLLSNPTVETYKDIVIVAQTTVLGDSTVILQQKLTHPFTINSVITLCNLYDLNYHDRPLYTYHPSLTSHIPTTASSNPSNLTHITSHSPQPLIFQVRTLVNILSHQGRFINLQRFLWDQNKLTDMSPLAAIQSIEELTTGILSNSSLSFTSKDCYRLWVEMERVYPKEAISAYDPHTFFSNPTTTSATTTTAATASPSTTTPGSAAVGGVGQSGTRITLQQTKNYEDFLKIALRKLGSEYPVETKELLYKFHIHNNINKQIDLFTLCMSLKERKMLPALIFHLNSFEAIAIYKQLLG